MRMQSFWGMACAAAFLAGGVGVRAEFVQGEINGWSASSGMDTNRGFVGDLFWSVTQTSTTTRAASAFQFTQSSGWDPQWGTGANHTNAVVNSTIGQAHGDLDSSSPGNLTFAEATGMKYTFRLEGDSGWWYRPYSIQATTNFPVSVSAVSDNSDMAGTNAVTVTATLSAAPSGERVYARWTTNNFGNSGLATASVTGATATIQIPGQPSGRTVTYYVLTSTMPTNVLKANYDLCTLRANNSWRTNYSYLVGEAEPVFGNCWHFPTNEEPASVTMRNPTNPTPSATRTSTWATTQGDADMTGGWVIYKESSAGTWSSNSLAWDSANGDNNYWVGRSRRTRWRWARRCSTTSRSTTPTAGPTRPTWGRRRRRQREVRAGDERGGASVRGDQRGGPGQRVARAGERGAGGRLHAQSAASLCVERGDDLQREPVRRARGRGRPERRDAALPLQGAGGWSTARWRSIRNRATTSTGRGRSRRARFDPRPRRWNTCWRSPTRTATRPIWGRRNQTASQRSTRRCPRRRRRRSRSPTAAIRGRSRASSGTAATWCGGGDTVQIWVKIGYEATNGYPLGGPRRGALPHDDERREQADGAGGVAAEPLAERSSARRT
jgi:hypothetical protein